MGQKLSSPSMYDTAATLAALDGNSCSVGQIALVRAISGTAPIPGHFAFAAGLADADANASQLVIVPATNGAAGRWIRCDSAIDLVLPISKDTADEAILAAMPNNLTLLPIYGGAFWEMSSAWAGGVASAIGLGWKNEAGESPQGGLLGGVSGDTTFPVVSFYSGTLGLSWTTGLKRVVLTPVAGQIIFNRQNSAFTQGTGNAHVQGLIVSKAIVPVNPS